MERLFTVFLAFVSLPLLAGWFSKTPTTTPTTIPSIEVSLYTGIPGVAKLGESFGAVTANTKFGYQRSAIEPESDLGKLGFNEYLQFNDIGARVYFRRDGVGMITAQAPFKGTIKGKNIMLFSFSLPPISNWEAHLVKELGNPDVRASGGRSGSQALFYTWGDICFNRMGANEIALYRNPELAKYREKNFGRELQLFPQK